MTKLKLKNWVVNTLLIILVALASMNLFINVNSVVKPILTIIAILIAIVLVNDIKKEK